MSNTEAPEEEREHYDDGESETDEDAELEEND
jgi:hypothetical protein